MAREPNIEGLEKVERIFRRLPAHALHRITDALNRGADEIVDLAQQLIAPVKGTDPEHVRDTIRRTEIRAGKTGRGLGAYVVITAGDTKETWQAARRTEYGREPGGGGVNVKHKGHDSQPFFWPAYWKLRRRVRSRVAREINRAAKEAAKL